jgi:hypothetical protein
MFSFYPSNTEWKSTKVFADARFGMLCDGTTTIMTGKAEKFKVCDTKQN